MFLIKYIHIVLAAWAVIECLRDRDDIFWFFIVLFIPVLGPCLYFAYKYNWVGRFIKSKGGATFMKPSLGGLRIKAKRSNRPQDWEELGLAFYEHRRWPEALAALEKVLESEGPRTSKEARFALGIAYMKTGRFRDAATQLNLLSLEDANYRYGEVLRNLAQCQLKLEQLDKALKNLKRLVEGGGTPADRFKYGETLQKAGREDEAIEQMKSILGEAEEANEGFRREWSKSIESAREFLSKYAAKSG